jgi:hypothetical protein
MDEGSVHDRFLLKHKYVTTTVKFGSQLSMHAKTVPQGISNPLAPTQFTCYSALHS